MLKKITIHVTRNSTFKRHLFTHLDDSSTYRQQAIVLLFHANGTIDLLILHRTWINKSINVKCWNEMARLYIYCIQFAFISYKLIQLWWLYPNKSVVVKRPIRPAIKWIHVVSIDKFMKDNRFKKYFAEENHHSRH